MDQMDAAARADQLLDKLITHQAEFLHGALRLSGVSNAKDLAAAIATLRIALIEELKKQPG